MINMKYTEHSITISRERLEEAIGRLNAMDREHQALVKELEEVIRNAKIPKSSV